MIDAYLWVIILIQMLAMGVARFQVVVPKHSRKCLSLVGFDGHLTSLIHFSLENSRV